MKRSLKAIALAAATAALLAGCTSTSNTPQQPNEEGLTPVSVGVLSNVAVAPIYLGVKKGFFEEAGLDVTLTIQDNGAAVVPAVLANDMQFGFSNVASIITANKKDLPIQVVASGLYVANEDGKDQGVAVVPKGSAITSVADLEGKTIGTTSLGGMFTLTMRKLIEDAGIDSSKVNFTELGYAEILTALDNGQIDVGMLSEPFTTKALNQGYVPIAWPYLDTDPNLMISAYFAAKQFSADNPKIVDAFVAAMNKSLDYAEEHKDEARAVLADYTELSEDARANMILPRWSSAIETAPLQLVADLLVQDGQIADSDISGLIRK